MYMLQEAHLGRYAGAEEGGAGCGDGGGFEGEARVDAELVGAVDVGYGGEGALGGEEVGEEGFEGGGGCGGCCGRWGEGGG